jgi:hypothetical protein
MKTTVFGWRLPSCPNVFVGHLLTANTGYPLKICGYDGKKQQVSN